VTAAETVAAVDGVGVAHVTSGVCSGSPLSQYLV